LTSSAAFEPKPWLSPPRVRDLLREWISARRPSAVLRLGDGEFPILGYGAEAPWAHTAASLNTWFGNAGIPKSIIEGFAREMRQAVRSADVVGIPRPSRQRAEPHCAHIGAIFAHHALTVSGQRYADAGLHHFLQFLLAYDELLRDLPFLGVISGRDVMQKLEKAFSPRRIAFFPVPAEPRVPGPFTDLAPHMPDRFEALRREIDVPFRGAVFIVGAGGPGKVYCDWIKQRGGIALDVGSVLDAWDGTVSRRRIERFKDLFALEAFAKHRALGAAQRLARYRAILTSGVIALPPSPEELQALIDEDYEALGTA
jgi:hypothetical protein